MYPTNVNKDLKILKKLKIDFVFIPKTYEIYKKKRFKKLKIHSKKNVLCGKFRKDHFELNPCIKCTQECDMPKIGEYFAN